MIYYALMFICGLIFGIGLTISNMVNPNKIINFLDVTGAWDPSLLLVMLGAVAVTWIGYKYVLKQSRALFSEKFFLPENTKIDLKLISGAAIFGIGWGLSGYCPGPAITALGLLSGDTLYFAASFLVSCFILQRLM